MPYCGKFSKGKSPQLPLALRDDITGKLLIEDMKLLEEYEQLAKMVEVQGQRLKRLKTDEHNLSQANRLKLRSQWRSILRGVKVESLRKDIEILSQDTEREIERKDNLVTMLLVDLQEVEAQFQQAHRSHIIRCRKLHGIHNSRTHALLDEYEDVLGALKQEFEEEKQEILTRFAQERQELQNIVDYLEAEELERENVAKHNHETSQQEIRNKNVDAIHMLRHDLLNLIENLEEEFDQAYNKYKKSTKQRNQQFCELTLKDSELISEIKEQKAEIERLTNSIQCMKKKRMQNEAECKARNSALRAEKDAMTRHYASLKERMNKFRESETHQITELSKLARKSLKINNENLSQGERILKLMEQCRKYETVQEKVLPHYQSSLIAKDEEIETKRDIAVSEQIKPGQSLSVDHEGTVVHEWDMIQNFHKRYNKVLFDRLQLQNERQRLEEENRDLKGVLQQYLDGISISPDAVNKPNPLLVVNGRMNLVRDRPVRRLKASEMPQFVEGNSLIRSYSKQTTAHK